MTPPDRVVINAATAREDVKRLVANARRDAYRRRQWMDFVRFMLFSVGLFALFVLAVAGVVMIASVI